MPCMWTIARGAVLGGTAQPMYTLTRPNDSACNEELRGMGCRATLGTGKWNAAQRPLHFAAASIVNQREHIARRNIAADFRPIEVRNITSRRYAVKACSNVQYPSNIRRRN